MKLIFKTNSYSTVSNDIHFTYCFVCDHHTSSSKGKQWLFFVVVIIIIMIINILYDSIVYNKINLYKFLFFIIYCVLQWKRIKMKKTEIKRNDEKRKINSCYLQHFTMKMCYLNIKEILGKIRGNSLNVNWLSVFFVFPRKRWWILILRMKFFCVIV